MTKKLAIVIVLLAIHWFSVRPMFSQPASGLHADMNTEVLVVGASQSGVTAAIQAARQGAKVVLLAKGDWLGGSITEAGIAAVDGNELLAMQTGLWGEFLARLAKAEKNLMQYGWVSLFTFNPKIGNQVFEDWLAEERNIKIVRNAIVKSAIVDSSRKYPVVLGVVLENGSKVLAKVTIDASETGELLELAKVPMRIGWEYAGEFQEPSAPVKKSRLITRYPLQELTWAFYLKDYGKGIKAPVIPTPSGYTLEKARNRYWCSFKDSAISDPKKPGFDSKWFFKYKTEEKHTSFFSPESFITYGQVGPDLFMINWPKCGNDYSLGIDRIFSPDIKTREAYYQEARTYSLWFAKYIQDTLKEKGITRFGLADEVFEARLVNRNMPGFAYIPYNREVRRLEGFATLTENELLPNLKDGEKAKYLKDSIAIGNYANDHHYFEMAKAGDDKYFKLAPKSIKWGGRYTGTGFSIPYQVMLPVQVNGLLVAEKSWSVSHIANGSTRLQPVCMLMGQAAGSAAAIAAKKNIFPFDVSVKELQATLLNDAKAPPSLLPLYDLKPDNPYRAAIQRLILSGVIAFPKDGHFRPEEALEPEELQNWLLKAKLTESDLQVGSDDSAGLLDSKPNLQSLTRGQAAYLIEKRANTFKTQVVGDNTGQVPAGYAKQNYCAKLKKIGDGESFKAEWIKDANGKGLKRVTPFIEVTANTAGLITGDPTVYKFFKEKLSTEPKDYCFEAVYNHSGAWFVVSAILEK
jgi:hypothetical protein